jgi:hypothetical protein
MYKSTRGGPRGEAVHIRIQICWLPPELRLGEPILQWSREDQQVAIGAHSGIVTILSNAIKDIQIGRALNQFQPVSQALTLKSSTALSSP